MSAIVIHPKFKAPTAAASERKPAFDEAPGGAGKEIKAAIDILSALPLSENSVLLRYILQKLENLTAVYEKLGESPSARV